RIRLSFTLLTFHFTLPRVPLLPPLGVAVPEDPHRPLPLCVDADDAVELVALDDEVGDPARADGLGPERERDALDGREAALLEARLLLGVVDAEAGDDDPARHAAPLVVGRLRRLDPGVRLDEPGVEPRDGLRLLGADVVEPPRRHGPLHRHVAG